MATYTPNLNLYKPDSTDDFENFRAEFNNNMEKIDQSGGGGGGGGSAKVIKNQTLTFVSLVATVMDSDITADSDFIVYYYDEAEAESANITAVASAGTITFTAETAPINPIVCDIVLLDVSGGGGGGGSVNYSTTEQVIGTWVNGKPLYQITHPMTINISGGQTVTIATLSDCEDIVYFDGWIKESNIFYGLNDRTTRLTVNASGQLQFNSASSWNGSGYVTIRYTKITD